MMESTHIGNNTREAADRCIDRVDRTVRIYRIHITYICLTFTLFGCALICDMKPIAVLDGNYCTSKLAMIIIDSWFTICPLMAPRSILKTPCTAKSVCVCVILIDELFFSFCWFGVCGPNTRRTVYRLNVRYNQGNDTYQECPPRTRLYI